MTPYDLQHQGNLLVLATAKHRGKQFTFAPELESCPGLKKFLKYHELQRQLLNLSEQFRVLGWRGEHFGLFNPPNRNWRGVGRAKQLTS